MTLCTTENLYRLHLPETGSTLRDLQRPGIAGREERFVLVTADYQTAGRGQRGSSWESEAGKNLLFALGLRPAGVCAGEQFRLSQSMALAVACALDAYLPAGTVTVKWPNDIYYKDWKICGMLLEHDLSGTHIGATRIGVGVNVNQAAFRSDAPNPVSLRQILAHDVERGPLLDSIVEGFAERYRALEKGASRPIHAEYRARLYRGTGFHPYRDASGTFHARIADIEPNGRIVLEDTGHRLRRYAFKEVAAILPSR